jgi:hypothetical protein
VGAAVAAFPSIGPDDVPDDARRQTPDDGVLGLGSLLVLEPHRTWPRSGVEPGLQLATIAEMALELVRLLFMDEGEDRVGPERRPLLEAGWTGDTPQQRLLRCSGGGVRQLIKVASNSTVST